MRVKALGRLTSTITSERGYLLRRWFVTLAVGMLIAWVIWQILSRPTVLTVAVGPAEGEQAEFVRSVAAHMRQSGKPIRLKVLGVSDHAAALALFNDGKVDLAVLRSDQPEVLDARSFAIVDRRAVLLVTLADKSTKPPTKPTREAADASETAEKPAKPSPKSAREAADNSDNSDGDDEPSATSSPLSASRLVGRRIVVGYRERSSNLTLVTRLLALSGLEGQASTIREVRLDTIASVLSAREADVAALVVDPTTALARQTVASIAKSLGGPVVVGPPPSPEALVAIHRDVTAMDLPAGVLGGATPLPPQKMATVAITEEIVGRSDISETAGAQLAKALLEVRGRLTGAQSVNFEIETPPLDAQRRFMPHAGLSAYVNDRSTGFLEKYSDQIWLALFGLGLIGSSIASFAGRLGLVGKRPAPIDPMPGDIERLLGAIAKASTSSEVDQVRGELRALASERLRRAIADGQPASDPRHPNQWFALIDALAANRRDELATAASSDKGPSTRGT